MGPSKPQTGKVLRLNRFWLHKVIATALLAVVAGAPLAADPYSDGSVTAQYFDGLRRRHLFGLAEGYCLRQLAQESLTPDERAGFTLQLSQTMVEHARYTAGEEQAELWKRAAGVVEEMLVSHAQSVRRAELELQRARVAAARGEYFRWQAELFPHNAHWKTQAEAALSDAILQLKKLEQQLNESRGNGWTGGDAPESLPRDAVRKLRPLVGYEIGAAMVAQASLLPAGSQARAHALADAESRLAPVAQKVIADDVVWNSRALLAEAHRLRGNTDEVEAQLARMEKKAPPQNVVDKMTAVRARLLMDRGAPDDAAKLLVNYRTARRGLPGELWFLQAAAFASLREIAESKDDTQLVARLTEELQLQAEQADLAVGGFWAYRCRVVLETVLEAARFGSEAAPIVQQARAFYSAGKTDEAVQKYGEAMQAAIDSGDRKVVGDLAYTRASILLAEGRIEPAAESFHNFVQRFADHERAAEAHLLWAYCLGRMYTRRSTAERREQYRHALESHRERFAGHPTEPEASWMLAVLAEHNRRFSQAIELYGGIPREHKRRLQAQLGVARCFEKLIAGPGEIARHRELQQREAVETLRQYAAAFPDPPTPLSRTEAELAVRLARIQLKRRNPPFAEADELLQRVLSSSKKVAADGEQSASVGRTSWKALTAQAARLRIISLAARGQFAQAETMLESLTETGPAEMLNVLDGLVGLADEMDEVTRHALGELQLQAAERLDRQRDELNSAQQRRLDSCLADACLATNQPKRARALYEKLLAHSPRDKKLLRISAELLMECGTAECVRRAKKHWRQLESLENPGSRDWMQARYEVARCCLLLKQHDDCRKLLGVTRLLYPDRGGEKLRAKFEELERDLTEKMRRTNAN